METISARCSRDIRDLDGPQKLEIFLRTSQAKRTTGKMVSEVARLRLCTMTHSREDEHKGRHPFKKRAGQYKRRQQGCTTAKR